MKNLRHFFKLLILSFLPGLCGIAPLAAAPVSPPEDTTYRLNMLISTIREADKPFFSDGYVVFTAEKQYRYAGIAFEFEDYKTIHMYERVVSYDADFKPVDSVLFYVLKVPEKISEIKYRIVLDGLWTTDPLNPELAYNPENNLQQSLVSVPVTDTLYTELEPGEAVKFVYKSESGKRIRLAGSFTNWDSFIYELAEKRPGVYELELPLPPGTYYYAFYDGMSELTDPSNKQKVYTPDGRIASVLMVR